MSSEDKIKVELSLRDIKYIHRKLDTDLFIMSNQDDYYVNIQEKNILRRLCNLFKQLEKEATKKS